MIATHTPNAVIRIVITLPRLKKQAKVTTANKAAIP